MSTADDVLKSIKDNDIRYVDLRFTDPRGKMQHLTMDATMIDEDAFADGIMFDGSSIAGWKAINESDMTLMMDPETAHKDPFFAQSTMAPSFSSDFRASSALMSLSSARSTRGPPGGGCGFVRLS